MSHRKPVPVLVLTLASLPLLHAPALAQQYLDFDDDGFADLALGAPSESVDAGAKTSAGAHVEMAGTASGLSTTGSALWSQNSSGVLDSCEAQDLFASALASGDFNGDGRADLAVGIPGESLGSGKTAVGAVHVFYGSSSGLSATNDQFISEDTSAIEDTARAGDAFATALAVGDFDNDGFDDLAIGIPAKDVDNAVDAGSVHVIYGSSSGLTTSGDQVVTQNTPGVLDTAEASDRFGFALAAGDFNDDGFVDLAVGVPGEDDGSTSDAGALAIFPGSSSGLTVVGDLFYTQNTTNINDTSEAGDQYAFSLSAGDFNGDGKIDLAVGVPYEDVGSLADAGAVNVLLGSSSGLSTTNDQTWTQDVSGVDGTAGAGDIFGYALAHGNFNGDASDDLAIGAPNEDFGSVSDAGGVNVLYGSTASGLTATNDKFWSQSGSGIADDPEAGDHFAFALASADFDGDGFDDLACGVPDEDVGSATDAGAVNVLYGSSGGLVDSGDDFWTQDVGSIPGSSGAGDRLGAALPRR